MIDTHYVHTYPGMNEKMEDWMKTFSSTTIPRILPNHLKGNLPSIPILSLLKGPGPLPLYARFGEAMVQYNDDEDDITSNPHHHSLVHRKQCSFLAPGNQWPTSTVNLQQGLSP